jgi:hypothetical protein
MKQSGRHHFQDLGVEENNIKIGNLYTLIVELLYGFKPLIIGSCNGLL